MVSEVYTAEDIAAIGERAESFVDFVRGRLFAPDSKKHPPVFNLNQMAQVCGVSKVTAVRAVAKQEAMPSPQLPTGTVVTPNRREFTLEEVQKWARHWGCCHERTPGQNAAVIAVGISKGGVGKSTAAVNIAQGLSLKGYRVLCVDFDPQASLSSMLGMSPGLIEGGETFLPLAQGEDVSLTDLIKPTYWTGMDLLPASIGLNAADFFLPARQVRDPSFRFYDVLRKALADCGALQKYDYCVIDTPPAMSYLTINAFWAADAILTPLPPEGPDFASSVQFWTLLADSMVYIAEIAEKDGIKKEYSWLRVFASKVDRSKSTTEAVLEWMRKAYGPELLPIEIPSTSAISVAGANFSSLYDITKYVGSARTYARAREAYDKLVEQVDSLTRMYKWRVK